LKARVWQASSSGPASLPGGGPAFRGELPQSPLHRLGSLVAALLVRPPRIVEKDRLRPLQQWLPAFQDVWPRGFRRFHDGTADLCSAYPKTAPRNIEDRTEIVGSKLPGPNAPMMERGNTMQRWPTGRRPPKEQLTHHVRGPKLRAFKSPTERTHPPIPGLTKCALGPISTRLSPAMTLN